MFCFHSGAGLLFFLQPSIFKSHLNSRLRSSSTDKMEINGRVNMPLKKFQFSLILFWSNEVTDRALKNSKKRRGAGEITYHFPLFPADFPFARRIVVTRNIRVFLALALLTHKLSLHLIDSRNSGLLTV